MAITKIHAIKTTLKKAIDYICNPKKTDGKILIASYACAPETADLEFAITRKFAQDRQNGVVARHLIQAFEPGEVTQEKAHELGKQLAEEVLDGKYEYVVTTHIDKGHIHNHIIFNNVDMINHKRYNSNKISYRRIREISDRICKENDLSVIKDPVPKNISREEYLRRKEGTSWKEKLQSAINKSIKKSETFNDFINQMKSVGYEIKQEKYIAFRAPGQERFTRSKTLGVDYSEEAIRKRISGFYISPQKRRNTYYQASIVKINLITNVYVHALKSRRKGLAIRNLKDLANTVNFLTANGVTQYAQITNQISELGSSFNEVGRSIKAAEQKIANMGKIINAAEKYRALVPVYKEYEASQNREKFFADHIQEILIYEAARKELNENGVGQFINLGELKARFNELTQRKEKLYSDYKKTKERLTNFKNAQSNIKQILLRKQGRDPKKHITL